MQIHRSLNVKGGGGGTSSQFFFLLLPYSAVSGSLYARQIGVRASRVFSSLLFFSLPPLSHQLHLLFTASVHRAACAPCSRNIRALFVVVRGDRPRVKHAREKQEKRGIGLHLDWAHVSQLRPYSAGSVHESGHFSSSHLGHRELETLRLASHISSEADIFLDIPVKASSEAVICSQQLAARCRLMPDA